MSRSVKSPVTLLFLSVGAVSLLQLAGCVAPAIIPPAPVTEVRAIEMGQESRPLRFDKIVVRLPQGHVIGRSNMSLGCFDESEELVYKGGRSLLDPVFFQEASARSFSQRDTQSWATPAGSGRRTASKTRDFPSRIAAGSSDTGGSMQT